MRVHTFFSRSGTVSSIITLLTISLVGSFTLLPSTAQASRTLVVPISVATYSEDQVGFPTFVMKWDEGEQPDPLALRWGRSQVPVRGTGMTSIQHAFQFAVKRLGSSIRQTGTLSLYATFTGPLSEEGSTAEAALAIGFIALLKGDQLKRDITITGTLEGDGQIGQVAQVAEKTTAAARAGYHVLLVPRGQFYAPRVNRVRLTPESNVLVREVDTIEEAYEIMTGKKL
ncbi:MAG: Lon proteolytic domain-containing protein [Nitrospira sp.]|nr:MAG: Lon proteolytic domain-containing protein [Nitrospira sp.]